MKQGYNHLEVLNKSHNIAIFTTHVGLCRKNIFSFGINNTAKHFQECTTNSTRIAKGLKKHKRLRSRVCKDKKEHDKRSEEVLQRPAEKVTLKKNRNTNSTTES